MSDAHKPAEHKVSAKKTARPAAPKAAPRPPISGVAPRVEAPTSAKAGFFAGVTAVVLGLPTAIILGAKHLPKLLRRGR